MLTTLLIIVSSFIIYLYSDNIYITVIFFYSLYFFRKRVRKHINKNIDNHIFFYLHHNVRSFIKKYIAEEKYEYHISNEHKIFDKILEDIFYDFIKCRGLSIISLNNYLKKRNKYVFIEFIYQAEHIFYKLFNKLPEDEITLHALDRFFDKHIYV